MSGQLHMFFHIYSPLKDPVVESHHPLSKDFYLSTSFVSMSLTISTTSSTSTTATYVWYC
uniref:Uncharacterized protein n=1 Tax=Arion vulgaris TaxID=1028688 RepID=A0A0B7AX02_9EUPU